MAPPEQPQITEPLDEWVERLIDRALLKHQARDPLVGRVTKLEIRLARMVGYMAGAGAVGGFLAGLLIKMLP